MKIILLVLFILMIFLFFEIIHVYQDYKTVKNYKIYKIPSNEQEILFNCRNLGLSNTTKCLVENVITFYKYNITNLRVTNMDFERLKTEGGVCHHYEELYNRLGRQLGFDIKSINLQPMPNHVFSIIDDNNLSYCIIDQNEYWCT